MNTWVAILLINTIISATASLNCFLNLIEIIKSDLIVDATPVACDINIVKKYVTPEKLEELKLDMGYSSKYWLLYWI